MSGSRKEAFVPGQPRRCYLFPKRLSDSLAFPMRPALNKRGFTSADLLRHWEDIVGSDLGKRCQPVKLQPGRTAGEGALVLRVPGAWAPEVQHAAPVILERLSAWCGHRVASRLVLLQ
jgi:hypothetical protein